MPLPLGILKGCRLNAHNAFEKAMGTVASGSSAQLPEHDLTALRTRAHASDIPVLSASIVLVHREKSPHLLLTQHLLSPSLLNPLKVWYCVSIFFPCQLAPHLAFSSELINPIMFFTLNKNGIYRIQLMRHWTGPGFLSRSPVVLQCSHFSL